ncbi:MAG: hypothetical protein K2V38_12055 [Gemmataceae bacterium]|nr:hypothetical protein [Gemmataceae bacterium]
MYGPYLTLAEINTKYPDSLVLIGNPTRSRAGRVTGGYVILHATTREEFHRLFEAWDDPDVKLLANHYTGELKPTEILPPDAEPEPGAA